MNPFHFLENLNDDLTESLHDITGHTNLCIKEVIIKEGVTIVKFDILSMEGFVYREIALPNNFKQ